MSGTGLPPGGPDPGRAARLSHRFWLADAPLHLPVSGTSMAPFLQPGDVIEVARCGACDLSIGDLVVFRRAGEVVVHRLLATEGDRFLEKGDAQAIGNWHVWPETFGRVVRLRNEGAPWVDLRRSPWPARMRTQGRLHLFAHKLLAGQPQGAAPASSRLMARLAVAMARRHAGSAVRPRGKVARP